MVVSGFAAETFQSTQPSQAVTIRTSRTFVPDPISIHTALAGCDRRSAVSRASNAKISIHTALAGCDGPFAVSLYWNVKISIHTALAGCDEM